MADILRLDKTRGTTKVGISMKHFPSLLRSRQHVLQEGGVISLVVLGNVPVSNLRRVAQFQETLAHTSPVNILCRDIMNDFRFGIHDGFAITSTACHVLLGATDRI